MVKNLQRAGAPVDGIGAACHLTEAPNGSVLLKRLDRLSEAGVPIWISHYSFPESDTNKKAEALYDMALVAMR